jgi:hypothetical protein
MGAAVCVVCGKTVVGKRAGALYCSPACRRAAAVKLRSERKKTGHKVVKRGSRIEGLREGQVKVLAAIRNARGPLNQQRIAEEVGMHVSQVGRYVGAHDPAKRAANEAELGYPSLLTLGYVRIVDVVDDGIDETGHALTAAGKQALKEAQAKARTDEEE